MGSRVRGALALVVALVTASAAGACSNGSAGDTPSSTSAVATSGTPGDSPTQTGSGSTVGDLYRSARTASLSAASGHATGTQTRQERTLRIDVEGAANGSNQTVFITSPDGGTSEVRTVGEDHWLGGDEAFWVQQTGDPAAGRAMVGKYVDISESDATELGSFTLRGILTEYFSLPEVAAMESDTTEAARVDVDGRAAYLLGAAGGAQLWVAADGSGEILRAVGPSTAPSDFVFTEWDRAPVVTAPPASSVVEG